MSKNWGAIITVALALVACAVAWGATYTTVAQHSTEIVYLKTTDATITEILSRIDKNQALILQRLELLERRVP